MPKTLVFHDVTCSFKAPRDVIDDAKRISNSDVRYENFSHYVRAAVLRLNREHKEGRL